MAWALLSYVLLHILLGILALYKGQVNTFSLVYALVVNLRLVLVFALAWIVTVAAVSVVGRSWLRVNWKTLLLIPAAVVVGFGLLQATVLPIDFLQRFGYGPETIKPFETVDQKLDYVRIQSTLRGANPLGAYLVIVLAAAAVLLRRSRGRANIGLLVLCIGSAVVLLSTYSRSAYVGVAIALAALLALTVRSRLARKRMLWGLAGLALVAFSILAVFRDNDRLENVLFHTDENSASATSSNEQRASALQSGIADVLAEPFGRGPGTAGPASVHNDQPVRIAENYYLQIGQETGWLGIGLFIAILSMIGRRLWRARADPLARALLVSLAGLSFINLVQHAWTDDTLAIVWWGMAGVAVAAVAATEVRGKSGRSKSQ